MDESALVLSTTTVTGSGIWPTVAVGSFLITTPHFAGVSQGLVLSDPREYQNRALHA